MAKTTYICGNCGARFVTSETPKGCPVCWSEHTVIVSRRLTTEEALENNLRIVEDAAREIAVHEQAIQQLRKESFNARQFLRRAVAKGRNIHIPTYKDYMPEE